MNSHYQGKSMGQPRNGIGSGDGGLGAEKHEQVEAKAVFYGKQKPKPYPIPLDEDVKVIYTVDDNFGSDSEEDCVDLLNSTFRKTQPYDYSYDLKAYRIEETEELARQLKDASNRRPGVGLEAILQLNDFTKDEVIHKKLRKRYGLLDTQCPEYTDLFEGFKMEVIEEYENLFTQLKIDLEEEELGVDGLLVMDLGDFIDRKVKPEEVLGYFTRRKDDFGSVQSANALVSGVEPYAMPRPSVKTFVKENQARLKAHKRKMRKKKIETSVPLPVNRGYKQLEEGHWNFAAFGFCTEHLRLSKFNGYVWFPLVTSLLNVVRDYPLGISPTYLYREFERRHGYKIDYDGLEFRSFEDMMTRNPQVFHLMRGETLFLVFPSYRGNLARVDIQQRRLMFLITVMMKELNVPIPVKEIPTIMKKMFGIRIDIRALGQGCDELYYRELIRQHASLDLQVAREGDGVLLRPIDFTKPTQEEITEDERRVLAMTFQKVFTRNGSSQPTRLFPKIMTEEDMFALEDKLEAVEKMIRPGRKYFVYPELMITPMKFYVSLKEMKELRDEFVIEMTDRYNDWMKKDQLAQVFVIPSDRIKVGNYVAVKYEDEWARARILEKTDRRYKVLLVDMGVTVKGLRWKELKYIHKDFATEPEMAFLCGLENKAIAETFGVEALCSTDVYTDEALEVFYSSLRNRILGLVPIRFDAKRRHWQVKLFITDDSESECTVLIPNLSKSLRRIFNGLSSQKVTSRNGEASKDDTVMQSSTATATNNVHRET